MTAAANWLASLASKLDAVVIVALITGCVSIVGVLISSIVAKRIEYKRSRQEYLAKKREEPYGQFVDMVYKIQQNTKKGGSYTEAQMLEDLSQFSKQILLMFVKNFFLEVAQKKGRTKWTHQIAGFEKMM